MRPLRIETTFDSPGLKYDLEKRICDNNFSYDVLVYEVTSDGSTWTVLCVPCEIMVLMLYLQLELTYDETLPITGVSCLIMSAGMDTALEMLEAIRVPDPSDYPEVLKYIRGFK